MKHYMNNRIIKEARYFTESNKTIREVAQEFNISKSTVHKDLKERLPLIDNYLSIIVNSILKDHLNIRHIRGGESTELKYRGIK